MIAVETPDSYSALLDVLVKQSGAMLKDNSGVTRGLGLCVPGLVNRRLEQVVFSPNLHQLDGRKPAKDLAARLNLPVVLLQESHAICLGERLYGAAQGANDFAMLDVSTGLGLAVMSGGRPLLGHSGLAGELGHLTIDPQGIRCGCGNRGCLETLATDSALAAHGLGARRTHDGNRRSGAAYPCRGN